MKYNLNNYIYKHRRTQGQARNSQRILHERRESYMNFVVKNKTFISNWFGHGIAKRSCAPAT